MWTKALDPAVKPFPILQICNIIAGIFGLCWEYPLPFLIPNTALHRSIAARLAIYPISILLAALTYQGTNAAIYYIVGLIVFFWGHTEGEIVCMPWKVPTRRPVVTLREPIKSWKHNLSQWRPELGPFEFLSSYPIVLVFVSSSCRLKMLVGSIGVS